MLSRPVLIADTDPHTIRILPRILSDHFPQMVISICTSVEDLSYKLKSCSYGAVACSALNGNAFDLIVKPIVSQEAALSVKRALWQGKLLRLLASKERAAYRFLQHMKMFPLAVKMEHEFAHKLATYDKTRNALDISIRLLLNIHEDRSFFDMAADIERRTKEQALDRLFKLRQVGLAH